MTVARRCGLFVIRWLQRAMFLGGVACAAWLLVAWKDATVFQLHARSELHDLIENATGPATGLPDAPAPLHPLESVVGLLDVPRLALSVVAIEGDDDDTLRIAAGHLPDTALPWQEGNASFAGHRDTFFRALRDVRVGDDINIATVRGTFRYRVTRTLVVDPSDISVLYPHDATALTLITCYPFTYVGDAPQRFVVHAERFDDVGPPRYRRARELAAHLGIGDRLDWVAADREIDRSAGVARLVSSSR